MACLVASPIDFDRSRAPLQDGYLIRATKTEQTIIKVSRIIPISPSGILFEHPYPNKNQFL